MRYFKDNYVHFLMTHILSDPKTLVLTWLSPTHLALKVG